MFKAYLYCAVTFVFLSAVLFWVIDSSLTPESTKLAENKEEVKVEDKFEEILSIEQEEDVLIINYVEREHDLLYSAYFGGQPTADSCFIGDKIDELQQRGAISKDINTIRITGYVESVEEEINAYGEEEKVMLWPHTAVFTVNMKEVRKIVDFENASSCSFIDGYYTNTEDETVKPF